MPKNDLLQSSLSCVRGSINFGRFRRIVCLKCSFFMRTLSLSLVVCFNFFSFNEILVLVFPIYADFSNNVNCTKYRDKSAIINKKFVGMNKHFSCVVYLVK